jgi:hypothetical protein
VLSGWEWFLGTSAIAAVFMSVVGGIIAISMFRSARSMKQLRAWKFLIITLVLFAAEEVFGALKSFGIFQTEWITHVIPSFIMIFLITALIIQLNMK